MGILRRNVPPKPGKSTVTIIARGNRFSGDIQIQGKTHIDGMIQGHIVTEEDISLGQHGVITGKIHGTRIFVSGLLEGEVICDHLFIQPGGKVHAHVCCAEMKIDQGGMFVGERTLPEPVQGVNPNLLMNQLNNAEQNDIFDSLPERITLSRKS